MMNLTWDEYQKASSSPFKAEVFQRQLESERQALGEWEPSTRTERKARDSRFSMIGLMEIGLRKYLANQKREEKR